MGMRRLLIGCTMLRKMAQKWHGSGTKISEILERALPDDCVSIQKSVKYLKEPFLMIVSRDHILHSLCALSRLLWTGMHMALFTVTSFLGIRLLCSSDKAPFPTLCRFLTSCTASVPHHKICFWYGSLISQNVKWGFPRLGMHGATFTVTHFQE